MSDEFLLRQLRAFAKRVGNRVFTPVEFSRWKGRRCAAATIRLRFRSWRRALGAIGICEGRAYDKRHLIKHLEAVWREMGRPPGTATLRMYGDISVGPYARNWGSLRRACVQLGRYKQGEISMKELLAGGESGARSPLAPGRRWDVLERDGHRCRSCGRTAAEHGVALEVDHIVPVAKGGADEMENLRTLCWECNRGKRDKAPGAGAVAVRA